MAEVGQEPTVASVRSTEAQSGIGKLARPTYHPTPMEDMLRVCVEAIDTGHLFRSRAYLSDVRYDTEKLIVTVTSQDDGTAAAVTFAEVIGFRVLDEGDLLEFWPACAADNGWLFIICQGGWFDQEIGRPGFLHEKTLGLTEYFIASQNDCISVLAGAAPQVENCSS
jgi:hypothetical protein